MTKIIIGKQGDQKFPIKNAGVSRQHASITIEGGHWILEDLDSTNGTFVRDDNGLYQRVSRVEIKEDTMVRLGDESSNGYAFMAHHVVEDDPENYAYEFARLAEWRDQFKKERERCQAAQRNRGMADTDHNKEVTVMELFKYIYKDVTARVEKRNSNAPDDRYKVRQHPQLVAAKRSYNMVLTKW